MYGMMAVREGNYDSIGSMIHHLFATNNSVSSVAPQQAVYDGVASPRDGGYMTVVRPPAAGDAFNPMYAAPMSEDNYEGVSSKAVRSLTNASSFLPS